MHKRTGGKRKFIVAMITFIVVILITIWPQGKKEELNIPFITTKAGGFIASSIYMVDGMVVEGDNKTTLPIMDPWGANNGLGITLSNRYEAQFFNLHGTTLGEPAGFSSQLNYEGKYLSIVVGEVNKSKEAYVSFSFKVQGEHGEYLIVFSFGSITREGWFESNYYERLFEFSSMLLDLENLLSFKSDEYSRIIEFNIVVAENLVVSMDFRLDLGKTTVNLPCTVSKSSWVSGSAGSGGKIVYSKTVVHSFFSFFSYLKIEFSKPPLDFQVESGEWDLLSIEEKDSSLLMVFEREIYANELTLGSIRNIDVAGSVNRFQSIDWLFLALLGLMIFNLGIWSIVENNVYEK
ncbi:MAG: hypothetical protein NWF11_01635 [Candidatus Bathyarchaeota archaeon]|nr:hypothetical protein [Candidatus Bathyarchaeota archaeon]